MKAEEVANNCLDPQKKYSFLKIIINECICKKNISETLRIISNITDQFERDMNLLQVVRFYVENGNLVEARNIANLISDINMKELAFLQIESVRKLKSITDNFSKSLREINPHGQL